MACVIAVEILVWLLWSGRPSLHSEEQWYEHSTECGTIICVRVAEIWQNGMLEKHGKGKLTREDAQVVSKTISIQMGYLAMKQDARFLIAQKQDTIANTAAQGSLPDAHASPQS